MIMTTGITLKDIEYIKLLKLTTGKCNGWQAIYAWTACTFYHEHKPIYSQGDDQTTVNSESVMDVRTYTLRLSDASLLDT